MTITAMVMADRPEEYTGKRGLVKSHVLVCVDAEQGVNRCTTQLEYTLTEDEKGKYAGKLQDKTISLGIREIVPIGGRVRVRGSIVNVNGLK